MVRASWLTLSPIPLRWTRRRIKIETTKIGDTMTQNRVWTAILINWQGHETRVVSVDAPYDTSGLKDYIEAKYPGQCLIAAVPGNHAGHAQPCQLLVAPGCSRLSQLGKSSNLRFDQFLFGAFVGKSF